MNPALLKNKISNKKRSWVLKLKKEGLGE